MFATNVLGVLVGTLLFVTLLPEDVAAYSKYGRTCRDIGCPSDELCVMAEDPCTLYSQDKCGRYPTCRKANAGEASCASIVCNMNEYCKTENGVPKCVAKSPGVGYESAGVLYVNGERTGNGDTTRTTSSNANSNNPYANANAPPAPANPLPGHGGSYHQVNSGSNMGYPPYPSSAGTSRSGSNGANNGYPPYPSTNQGNRQSDLGYPPYPASNRMPVPGQAAYPGHANPGYPQAGYPQSAGYPQQQYPSGQRYPAGHPGYQNYPYSYPSQNRVSNTYSGYRASAATPSVSMMTAFASMIATIFNVRWS